ncbi:MULTISPECIES: hypothetical protein [Novosphingobium]|uniref:Uncharacterized protein n=1 Tax=Novosphingobium mathurense TaxID=428990 RepID=A0A1U6ICJ5_9SPHN|nr:MULTISPECIES: hypothetical protein [Novosphingobium]CDO35754.1 hypothetical protein SPHV1_2270100 [Novosphingobium sp. KN65.2]SLK05735.1 hypothetical protein SAMN06295987_105232 [Novosphingobium mathurense]
METRGEEIHIDKDEARAGDTPNIVRYVLLISLALAIVALSAIWITGALTDDNPEGNSSATAAASVQGDSMS